MKCRLKVLLMVAGLELMACSSFDVSKTGVQYTAYANPSSGLAVPPKKTDSTSKSGVRTRKEYFESIISKSAFDIYDFHVPQFPSFNSSVLLACGYKETSAAKLHELKWLKDGSVFFSYQPKSRQTVTIIPDRDWLKTNTLSHMQQTIDLRGQHQDKSNLTVVYIRLSGVTEEMSGTFTCQLSMSIPHTTTGLFTFIRSRTGELSVTPTIEQRLSPVVKLGESLGYARGDAINILCSISGKPAPHVVWNYIREDSDGEEEVEAVGQGRLEMFPLAVTKDGTETRKVGLHILCCTETKLSCNLHTSDDQIVRAIVQVLEHGDGWRLEVFQENPALEEEEAGDTGEEDGEEEGDEEEIWSLELMLGVGVSSGVLLIAIIICVCCCCCSCKRRRARRLRNREINRREIYSINSSERGRVRSLSRRSTKRKAPNPAFQRVTEYQLQEEPLTISP